jgi:hypothetical protein
MLRLAQSTSRSLAATDTRLVQTQTRELVLERQLAAGAPPLAIPDLSPTPTVENSWLIHEDPKQRFHFLHPQELRPDYQVPAQLKGDTIVLVGAPRPEGPDVVNLRLQPKSMDPAAYRQSRDPEYHRKSLLAAWSESKTDVARGPAGWLPEADWAPFNMRVYRIEAVLKPKGPEGAEAVRIHLDHYLILFSRDESMVVTSTTAHDPPTSFRKLVEATIKTFKFTPSSTR